MPGARRFVLKETLWDFTTGIVLGGEVHRRVLVQKSGVCGDSSTRFRGGPTWKLSRLFLEEDSSLAS